MDPVVCGFCVFYLIGVGGTIAWLADKPIKDRLAISGAIVLGSLVIGVVGAAGFSASSFGNAVGIFFLDCLNALIFGMYIMYELLFGKIR